MIHIEEVQGRVHLHMTVQHMGCDYTVALYGGDAHVGAVALGVPEGTDITRGVNGACGTHDAAGTHGAHTTHAARAQVLSVPGHREEALACSVAQHLASTLQARVCVACGIHWDHISADEITTVLMLAESLTHKAVVALTNIHCAE